MTHAAFELRRSYGASIARVWHALTDPTAKDQWFRGPPGRFDVVERQMDVRAGVENGRGVVGKVASSPPSTPSTTT